MNIKNESEKRVAARLEKEGWKILKRGWPDFLCYRDGKIRFVEVKPNRKKAPHLSPYQQKVADLLLLHFGIVVEILVPDVPVDRNGPRKHGVNSRALGCNPRAMGTNPRANRDPS